MSSSATPPGAARASIYEVAARAGDYKTQRMTHIVEAAARRLYLVEFVPADALDLLTKHLVEGVIELGLTSGELRGLEELSAIPTTLINARVRTRRPWNTVCSDHKLETRLATNHLLERGHKRIALVLDELDGWASRRRREGYESALKKHGRASAPPLVFSAVDMAPSDIARGIMDAS